MLKQSFFEFSSNLCGEVQSMIDFLKSEKIEYFSFSRIHRDGKTQFLCSDYDWIKVKFENNLFDYQGFFPAEKELIENNRTVNIFTGDSYKNNDLLEHLYNSGRWNSLDLYDRQKDHIDIAHFGSNKTHIEAINFYINNIELLRDIHQSFIKKFDATLQESIEKNIYLDINDYLQNETKEAGLNERLFHENATSNFDSWEKQRIEKAVKALQGTAITLDHGKVKLSARELECTLLLTRGSSFKEIASQLDISPRTVETHIKNIKDKMFVHSKSSLIKTFNDHLGLKIRHLL